jgi:PAS domain S-box-containing protein
MMPRPRILIVAHEANATDRLQTLLADDYEVLVVAPREPLADRCAEFAPELVILAGVEGLTADLPPSVSALRIDLDLAGDRLLDREICYRVATELELRRLRSELARRESGNDDAVEEVSPEPGMLAQTFELAAVGLTLSDPDGHLLNVNRAYCEIVGYEASELIGRHGTFLLAEEERPAAELRRLARRCGETPPHRDWKVFAKGGRPKVIRSTSSRLRTAGGEGLYLGVVVDITEQRQAEADLRASDERYRSFIRQSTEGIWRFETPEPIPIHWSEDRILEEILARSRLAECNDAMARMYGFAAAEDLIGVRLSELFLPTDPDNLAVLRQYIRSGFKLVEAESREQDRFGQEKWFVNNVVGIVKDGRLLRSWGLQRDITAQRRAAEALRESELRFRGVVESDMIGFIFWHADGYFWDANQHAADMLGYPLEELRSGRLRWSEITPPEYYDLDTRKLNEILANGVMRPFEKEFIRVDGTRVPVLLAGALLAGDPRRGVAYVMDISERRRTEQRLRDADRRKDEFLAMLAHELRNPLAPIVSAVELMELIGLPEGEVQWCKEVIERQVQHLVRLVDDLLDVSRITRGKIKLRREPVDLAAVVARAVETSRPIIAERKQELVIESFAAAIVLQGDLTRLAQVIGNLLTNASKYSDEQGRIWLSVAAEGSEAVIRVRDLGCGIASEVLPHVFDLFTQADRTLDRSQGGLGIGLTLVKALTELHGGTVSATSGGLGQGSEFSVRLPLASAEDSSAAPTNAEIAPSARRRVLVVDDNVDAALSLSRLLQADGHEVEAVHDGAAALASAPGWRPDVILLDIGLPGLDGYEVARRLRQHPQTEKTLLIALTGYGQDEDRRRSQEAGFDHHLVKPIERGSLRKLLG